MPTPTGNQLPKALTSLPNWVGWRSETRDGSTKKTKVPYNLATGHRASSTNPADWIEFPEPSDVPLEYDGIGFVLTKVAGITGIDLDDCLDEAGEFKPWAKTVIKEFESTYYEISPSGKGAKIFAAGLLPGPGRKVFVDSAGNPTVESMSDGAIEMYDNGRYFTVTGLALSLPEITDSLSQIDALYRRMERRRHQAVPTVPEGALIPEGNRHNHLLAVGGRLRNQGFDRISLLSALETLNLRQCQPPKPDREVVGIVDFVMTKPPKYRLTPDDCIAAQKTADGNVASRPETAPEPQGPSPTDMLSYTEDLLADAIASRNPMEVLGVGTKPSPLILALAQAGDVKQHEARRRIKDAFGKEIPLRELDARIKQAEYELRPVAADSSYIMNSEGRMIANLANAITMLQELPLKFNAFTGRTVLTESSPWGSSGDWIDNDDVSAQEWCQRRGLNIPHTGTISNAVEKIARSRKPHFHPVQEYLKSLKWDGEPRLSTWLHDYIGALDNEYISGVSRKWMISAVKRIMEPGCQSDYTLVLEGAQGKRKSTALRIIGGDWFTDDIAEIGKKDSAIQLQGKWIVELAELDAFRRAELTTIKAWLVRREDHFRPPYGRRAEDFPRQNVFAATTNKRDWGQDDTGLRRFWPVAVGEIDVEGLKKVRDQLWAEARFAYDEGELSYLTEGIERMAAQEQHARQDQDPWTDTIEEWVAAPTAQASIPMGSSLERIYLHDVLEHCLKIPKDRWSQSDKRRVTRILRIARYTEKRESKKDIEPGKSAREYWTKLPD